MQSDSLYVKYIVNRIRSSVIVVDSRKIVCNGMLCLERGRGNDYGFVGIIMFNLSNQFCRVKNRFMLKHARCDLAFAFLRCSWKVIGGAAFGNNSSSESLCIFSSSSWFCLGSICHRSISVIDCCGIKKNRGRYARLAKCSRLWIPASRHERVLLTAKSEIENHHGHLLFVCCSNCLFICSSSSALVRLQSEEEDRRVYVGKYGLRI